MNLRKSILWINFAQKESNIERSVNLVVNFLIFRCNIGNLSITLFI